MTEDRENRARMAKDSLDEAINWMAQIHSGNMTQEQGAEFESWVRSRDHAIALAHAEQTWRDAGYGLMTRFLAASPPESEEPTTLAGPVQPRLQPRLRRLGAVCAAFTVCALAGLFALYPNYRTETFQYISPIGELDKYDLPDGTTVTLGGDTAISGSYSGKKRKLVLEKGRIFIDVTHDEARPFHVLAGTAQIEVVGTAFDVDRTRNWTNVSVSRGKVQVSGHSASTKQAHVTLTRGRRVRVYADGRLGETKSFATSSLSWVGGRLEYVDAPLSEVILEMNRFRSTPIVLMDKSLADIRVTFSAPADKTDIIIDGIEATLPVDVTRTPTRVLLYAR